MEMERGHLLGEPQVRECHTEPSNTAQPGSDAAFSSHCSSKPPALSVAGRGKDPVRAALTTARETRILLKCPDVSELRSSSRLLW